MKAFTALLSICTVVAGTYGLFTVRSETEVCAGAKAVESSSVKVGSKVVELTTFSCDARLRPAAVHVDDDPVSGSSAVTLAPSPTAPVVPTGPLPTVDVCGEICKNVCGDSGELPPTTDDCTTIVDAITILNGSVAPSFAVAPGHVQTLTFGTCRFFFENDSPAPQTNCWLSFVQTASAAASACLPPVQPVNSEGICIASDASWRVGVAHS
ncbi:hypothetical protein C8Q77DRAFT_1159369 [Trametes polyzona]|nr:hypothetical protein C8Q77DRAFT_1159369 [Trametes polyzona]